GDEPTQKEPCSHRGQDPHREPAVEEGHLLHHSWLVHVLGGRAHEGPSPSIDGYRSERYASDRRLSLYVVVMSTTTATPEAGAPPTPGRDECCTLSSGPVGSVDAERIASVLKALSDPTRLRLLSHVAAQGCDSVCACDLTEPLGIS